MNMQRTKDMGASGSSTNFDAFALPSRKGLSPSSAISEVRETLLGVEAKRDSVSLAFLFPRLEMEEDAESGGVAGCASKKRDQKELEAERVQDLFHLRGKFRIISVRSSSKLEWEERWRKDSMSSHNHQNT
jgi:hypothetical protein